MSETSVYHFRRLSWLNWLAYHCWRPYRRRRDAATKAAIRYLVEHPEVEVAIHD